MTRLMGWICKCGQDNDDARIACIRCGRLR